MLKQELAPRGVGIPVLQGEEEVKPEDHKMQGVETTTPAARGQSAQMVWDAILELHNAEKRINRQSIAALTGLRPTIVDDHVERLRDAGKLARAGKGDLELLETFPPPRPISKTELSNGLVKIEVGDVCLDLSPKEMRMLYRACAGHARDMHEIDEANKAVILCHELAREIADLRRQLREAQAITVVAKEKRQLELLECD